MRLQGQAKMGFFPAADEAVDGILKHLAMPPDKPDQVCVMDPCSGEGAAVKRLTEGLGVVPARVYCVELDKTRAGLTQAAMPQAKVLHAGFSGTMVTQYSMGLVYCNPPYDDELGGGRREELTFVTRATWALVPGGVLAFVIPMPTLQKHDVVNFLDANYENIRVYKFPEAVRKYREIVVFGVRRKFCLGQDNIYSQGELTKMDWQYGYVRDNHIATLGEPAMFKSQYKDYQKVEHALHVYRIPWSHAPHTFKKISLTEEEKQEALRTSPLVTLLSHAEAPPPKRPPLPLGRGHVAILLASGMLDGVISTPAGVHVVRGTSIKEEYISERKTLENDRGDVTGEKVVYSQRIVMTIRAVDETGVIRTFTDSPVEAKEGDDDGGAEIEDAFEVKKNGSNGYHKALEAPAAPIKENDRVMCLYGYEWRAGTIRMVFTEGKKASINFDKALPSGDKATIVDQSTIRPMTPAESVASYNDETTPQRESARSWKVGVVGVGESTLSFNGLRFAKWDDADTWGDGLMMRWTGAERYEVVGCDEEPNK